jgi:hypothetical protein
VVVVGGEVVVEPEGRVVVVAVGAFVSAAASRAADCVGVKRAVPAARPEYLIRASGAPETCPHRR